MPMPAWAAWIMLTSLPPSPIAATRKGARYLKFIFLLFKSYWHSYSSLFIYSHNSFRKFISTLIPCCICNQKKLTFISRQLYLVSIVNIFRTNLRERTSSTFWNTNFFSNCTICAFCSGEQRQQTTEVHEHTNSATLTSNYTYMNEWRNEERI